MTDAAPARLLAGIDTLPVLESERLHLRPIREDDLPDLYAVFADPDVMRYWSTPPMRDMDEARAYLAGISRKQAIPLLEQLDREGTTRRQGDDRVRGAGKG